MVKCEENGEADTAREWCVRLRQLVVDVAEYAAIGNLEGLGARRMLSYLPLL